MTCISPRNLNRHHRRCSCKRRASSPSPEDACAGDGTSMSPEFAPNQSGADDMDDPDGVGDRDGVTEGLVGDYDSVDAG